MATSLVTSYVLADNDRVVGDEPTKYVLRIRDMPPEQKPREKLLAFGPHDLSHAELVAIILGVGTRREEVLKMARRILLEYGERTIVAERDPKRLSETLQIPLAKACQIIACFEIGRRFFDRNAGQPVYVRTSAQAYEHLRHMSNLQKEQLRGLYLNSRYQVIHEEAISIGSLTANIVHPREVFRPAIQYGAVAVVIAHNHPSSIADPTDADLEVTAQLIATGRTLGIDLLDHLVIVEDGYRSIVTGGEI